MSASTSNRPISMHWQSWNSDYQKKKTLRNVVLITKCGMDHNISWILLLFRGSSEFFFTGCSPQGFENEQQKTWVRIPICLWATTLSISYVSPHISVVRLTLPSWDIVNKQGQRWIPGITAARTIHLQLLCLLVLQKSAQHESSKTSLAFTEQKCCQHLLQLALFHSNSISPAMLDLLQHACCIQIQCIGGKAPSSIQSRDKLHICCLNKCSFAQKGICGYVHCQGELLGLKPTLKTSDQIALQYNARSLQSNLDMQCIAETDPYNFIAIFFGQNITSYNSGSSLGSQGEMPWQQDLPLFDNSCFIADLFWVCIFQTHVLRNIGWVFEIIPNPPCKLSRWDFRVQTNVCLPVYCFF